MDLDRSFTDRLVFLLMADQLSPAPLTATQGDAR